MTALYLASWEDAIRTANSRAESSGMRQRVWRDRCYCGSLSCTQWRVGQYKHQRVKDGSPRRRAAARRRNQQ